MASTVFVDGETLIEASWLNDVNTAVYNPSATSLTAADIANVPAGSITATDVQAALNELDTEKVAVASIGTTVQAWDAQLDALALLSTGTASGNIPLVGTKSATESLAGLVELATQAEAEAGTDATRAITPSTLRGGLNAAGSAPVYACRAWVNFDGTLAAASMIKASGNVSSITDNGVGDYTVNFTTAIQDANYCAVFGSRDPADAGYNIKIASYSSATYLTTSMRIKVGKDSFGDVDSTLVSVAIFR